MWVDHPSSLALFHLLRETMDNAQGRMDSPTPDKVSSAADAMLKLSSSVSPDPALMMQFNRGHVNAHAQASPEQGYSSMSKSSENHGHYFASHADDSYSGRQSRKQREFIPEFKKDECYWMKRRKNNEAAKRSREKRKMSDMVMGEKCLELSDINTGLIMELRSMKKKYGYPVDKQFPIDPEIEAHKPDYSFLSNSDSESSNNSLTSGANTSGTTVSGSVAASNLSHTKTVPSSAVGVLGSPSFHGSNLGNHTAGQFAAPVLPQDVSREALLSQQMPMLLPLVPAQVQGLIPSAVPACLPHPAIEGSMQYHSESKHRDQDDRQATFPGGPGQHSLPSGYYRYDLSRHQNVVHDQQFSPDPSSRSSSPELKINLSGVSTSSGSEMSEPDVTNPSAGTAECSLNPVMSLNAPPRGTHNHSDHAQIVENSRISGRKGVPFKLWHKISSSESQRDNHQTNEDVTMENHGQMVSSTSGSQPDSSNTVSSHQYVDPKYVERRQRNNQAARKCRENRKFLNDIRMQKSDLLENENQKLRVEMVHLSNEISNLRELVEKKKQAQANGDSFELPPLLEITKEQHPSESQDSSN